MAAQIKIMLLHGWMEELQKMTFIQLQSFDPADDHEHLLREHMIELAEAFLQFWMLVPFVKGSLQQVIIANMIGKIDKAAKDTRPNVRILS